MDNPQAVTTAEKGFMAPAGQIPASITENMPLALQVYFNDDLYLRCKQVSQIMSQARGVTPKHLIGQSEACFAVTTLALRTGIDPFFLAKGTYVTPGGSMGYMTNVINAVADAANVFERLPTVEYPGPWKEKVDGNFEYGKNDNDKDVPKRGWKRKDVQDCLIRITFYFRGEPEPKVFEYSLGQVGNMFSVQWDAEAKTQLFNLAFRRAMNQFKPGVLAGVQHPDDIMAVEQHETKDVTPKTKKASCAPLEAFAEAGKPDQGETVVEFVEEKPEDKPEEKKETKETKAKAEPKAKEEPPIEQKGLPIEEEIDPAPKCSPKGGVKVWASPDEPARTVQDLDAAAFVIGNLIEDAATVALASVILRNNMDTVTQAGAIDVLEKKFREKKRAAQDSML